MHHHQAMLSNILRYDTQGRSHRLVRTSADLVKNWTNGFLVLVFLNFYTAFALFFRLGPVLQHGKHRAFSPPVMTPEGAHTPYHIVSHHAYHLICIHIHVMVSPAIHQACMYKVFGISMNSLLSD
uniref:Uncharacterized protein n=1 Tax=Arundo donax TaxID=35708 RepID=A0A0A9P356_ARUDO